MPPIPSPPSAPSRSAWVDNLRTLIIVLVVNMHACVTYSHVGGWYVNEDPEPALPVKIAFVFWQGHLQAFFMGLLFFLAGAFAHRSLRKRGSGPFLRERVVRLGLPSLFYMVVIHPFMVHVLLGYPHIPDRPSLLVLYGRYITSGRVLSGNGPLWFALSLLFFCTVLAGWRTLRGNAGTDGDPGTGTAPPNAFHLLGFGVLLVISTFLVRLAQPIGTNVLNFQLCFFPQYIAAFIVGVAAGRKGWLVPLADSRPARVAGWLGIIGGPLLLATVAWMGGPPPEKGPTQYDGGWHLAAFGLATWEQLSGLGIGLGLLAWFHRHADHTGRFAAWLSDRAFAVYVLHAPILVALTLILHPFGTNPFLRMLLLTVTGLIASFAVADLAKRLPGFRRIV